MIIEQNAIGKGSIDARVCVSLNRMFDRFSSPSRILCVNQDFALSRRFQIILTDK